MPTIAAACGDDSSIETLNGFDFSYHDDKHTMLRVVTKGSIILGADTWTAFGAPGIPNADRPTAWLLRTGNTSTSATLELAPSCTIRRCRHLRQSQSFTRRTRLISRSISPHW